MNLDFAGRRVTVIGLGRHGGVGAVRFLADRGARVTVTDLAGEEELSDSLAQLDGLPLECLHLGGHPPHLVTGADLLVVSPAVPRNSRVLQIARRAGIPLTSEMHLFWQLNRGRVIGVTGSNGKSTTAALIGGMLQAGGLRARLGGNIGRSLLPEVDEIGPDEWIVLELSSFQLDDLGALAAPEIAVVTNFSPNHLDRHGSLAAYRRAKQRIVSQQDNGGTAVLNADDPDVRHWPAPGRRCCFGLSDHGAEGAFIADRGTLVFRFQGRERAVRLPELPQLPGRHNRQNILAAACAAMLAGADGSAVRAGLQRFAPLPHRLQFVGEAAGRRFYNDSLATTPESTCAALAAFSAPVVLLAGGYDKGVDLTGMAASIAAQSKAVALLGATARNLADSIAASPGGSAVPRRICGSLPEAFRWALECSAPGDVVLLSPGCASYDWFRDFAERGERFVELVRSQVAAKAA